jgi:DNA-binding transcriptional ArsR family regulator
MTTLDPSERDRQILRIMSLTQLQRECLDALASFMRPIGTARVAEQYRWRHERVRRNFIGLLNLGLVMRSGTEKSIVYWVENEVCDIMKEYGSFSRSRGKLDAENGLAILLTSRQMAGEHIRPSSREISRRINVSQGSVCQWMRRLGEAGLLPDTSGMVHPYRMKKRKTLVQAWSERTTV